MMRSIGIILAATSFLWGCGSPDRDQADTRRSTPSDRQGLALLDTANADASRDTAEDPHAQHGAAAEPGHDAHTDAMASVRGSAEHAGHGSPAAQPGAGADLHAGHAQASAAAGASRSAAGADPHAGHAQARPTAGAARAGAVADAHVEHERRAAEAAGHEAHDETATAPSAEPHAAHGGRGATAPGAGDPRTTAADAGASRLATLLTSLLEDPAVQQRIQQDPELRELWSAPAVQRHVATAPAMPRGMAKLLDLVGALMADPAVRARVEADPDLQELWSDRSVRRALQMPARP